MTCNSGSAVHRLPGGTAAQLQERRGDAVSVPRETWQWMYSTRQWKECRRLHRQEYPLCKRCLEKGKIVAAQVVHHVERHEGNWEIFLNSELESLCKHCHDSLEQGKERRGYSLEVGLDGRPIDPNHPANRPGRV